MRTVPGTVHSTPENNPRSGFHWWKMVGWKPRVGMRAGGDSKTHTSETPRSRVHVEAEISRLENNFVCLGKLVNDLGSHCYLTPLLMMPFLTGVKMAGFTHRPGFKIKIFQFFYFPQNFTPAVFAFLPGTQSSKNLQYPAAAPRFYIHFGCTVG